VLMCAAERGDSQLVEFLVSSQSMSLTAKDKVLLSKFLKILFLRL
jgi:hypothetical protein